MRIYFYLYIFLIPSVIQFTKIYGRTVYENNPYTNDRNSENSPYLTTPQKRRLSADNEYSARDDQDSEMAGRFRKFHPASEAQEETVQDLDNINNAGQSMYDMPTWRNDNEAADFDVEQQEPAESFDYPADKMDRKYSSDFDEFNNRGNERNLYYKKRRTSAIWKRKADAARFNSDKATNQNRLVKRKSENTDASKSDSSCPPHNTGKDTKSSFNNDAKTEKKRDNKKWSQEQITALTNSLYKAQDNDAEMDNVKGLLYNMGLVNNAPISEKRETVDSVKKLNNDKATDISKTSNTKEDEDLNEDNIILKRNDNKKWTSDADNEEQEVVNKREDSDNAEEDTNEESAEEPIQKSSALENESVDSSESENNAKEEIDGSDNSPIRKKRQNSEMQSVGKSSKDMKEEEFNNKMEAEIETKMNAIKEKVKRQLNLERQSKRYKRSTNLESMQNNDLDPNLTGNDDNKPHIRTRREASNDKTCETKSDSDNKNSKSETTIDASKSSQKSNDIPNSNEKNAQTAQNSADMKSIADNTNSNDRTVNAHVSNKVKNDPSMAYDIIRSKRANRLPEKQMIYQPFQEEQDDDEDEEFDDNSYDGRMYVDKRQSPDVYQYYQPRKRRIKAYNINNLPAYLQEYYRSDPRYRRDFEDDYMTDEAAFHGGALVSRKNALKKKSVVERAARDEDEEDLKSNDENEISDNEYFGGLPETYDGYLTRYKRVKRDR